MTTPRRALTATLGVAALALATAGASASTVSTQVGAPTVASARADARAFLRTWMTDVFVNHNYVKACTATITHLKTRWYVSYADISDSFAQSAQMLAEMDSAAYDKRTGLDGSKGGYPYTQQCVGSFQVEFRKRLTSAKVLNWTNGLTITVLAHSHNVDYAPADYVATAVGAHVVIEYGDGHNWKLFRYGAIGAPKGDGVPWSVLPHW